MKTAAVSALNTTCEGIWILQGLCGIETLPATLCLRPWLSESGTPPIHPALSESGAVTGETVHPTIARWLEVLAAPDIELCVIASRGSQHLRMVVARRDGLHAAASRCGDDVTIEEIGGVKAVRDLVPRILPLLGPDTPPARFDPMLVRSADLLDRMARHSGAKVWGGLGFATDQRRVATLALEQPTMAASFAVVVHDRRGDHVGLVSASVTDTPEGRVVSGPHRAHDGGWLTKILPGTPTTAEWAVAAVVSASGVDWLAHSRN